MTRLYLGGGVMHYKITLSFDHDKDGCAWIEEYINVNSLQEAEERIPQIAEDYKITKDYEIDIQETSIDEMIECEKEELLSKIQKDYIFRKYNRDTIDGHYVHTIEIIYNFVEAIELPSFDGFDKY